MKTTGHTAYERAFCATETAPVFKGIQGGHDIYRPDPFDVPEVHSAARGRFEQLIRLHSGTDAPNMGSVLLLKGRAGAGKTHLMRAFRDRIHRGAAGYFGYLQLTTQTENYHRYVLSALVDHLQRPYHIGNDPRTGLQRLSDTVAESSPVMRLTFPDTKRSALDTLREDNLAQKTIVRVVEMLAKRVLREKCFADIDVDLIRVLLYLQTRDPVLENKVKKYLRAERLSQPDEAELGGINSLVTEDAPARMLEQLGLLMWRTGRELLVIGVDQIEDIANMDHAHERFQRVVSMLTSLANNVPSCIVVLACLEDYYISLRQHLFGPSLDRLEQDPEPLTLHSHPAAAEVAPILAKRLAYLYEKAGLETPEPHTYPFDKDIITRLSGLSIRDVLSFARRWQEQCGRRGTIVPPPFSPSPEVDGALMPPTPALSTDTYIHDWNDYRYNVTLNVPAKSHELAPILAEGIEYCSEERKELQYITCKPRETVLYLDGLEQPTLVGVCNRAASGGALLREIEAFQKHLANERPVIVRAAGFPTATSKTGRLLAQIKAGGGRFLQLEDYEWRAILAMRGFRERHAGEDGFQQWLMRECPLTRLPGLRVLLELDNDTLLRVAPESKFVERAPNTAKKAQAGDGRVPPNAEDEKKHTEATPEKPAGEDTPASPTHNETAALPLRLGKSRSRMVKDVHICPEELTRHAAFLGGTGSGKTTIAMRLIEELLLRGIPALLLDRKGDLCGYAALGKSDAAEEHKGLKQLLDHIEPAVYTPGNPNGRPLRLRLLPPGMAALDDYNRGTIAHLCASSLCRMMGYGKSNRHKAQQSLLKATLEVLARDAPSDPVLNDIILFLEEPGPLLLDMADGLSPKTFEGLIEDLNVLRINKSHLFDGEDEPLDCGRFFAPTKNRRTPLTIISTKFLGDQTDTEFWTAQLFIELGRWIDTAPSTSLQGVVFCDEADLYLPAQRQPATKQPMEALLRRARSAGIGMLLATQSPGDFDYRCRDNIRSWFIGRIRENTALNKMKPLLQQYGDTIEKKLPGLEPGQFVFASEGHPTPMTAERCLVAPKQLPLEEILAIAKHSARK